MYILLLFLNQIICSLNRRGGRRDYTLKLEEVIGIICSLFVLVLIVTCCVCCNRFKMKDPRYVKIQIQIQDSNLNM